MAVKWKYALQRDRIARQRAAVVRAQQRSAPPPPRPPAHRRCCAQRARGAARGLARRPRRFPARVRVRVYVPARTRLRSSAFVRSYRQLREDLRGLRAMRGTEAGPGGPEAGRETGGPPREVPLRGADPGGVALLKRRVQASLAAPAACRPPPAAGRAAPPARAPPRPRGLIRT